MLPRQQVWSRITWCNFILNASWCKAETNVGAQDRFRPLFSTKIGLKWAALCHFSKWSDDRVLAGTTWNMKYCGWQLLPAGFNWATAVSPLQVATPERLFFSNLKFKILEFWSTTTWYGKSFNKSQNSDGAEWWLMWSFQCKRYSLFFLAFNNPCTWDNSCFLLFRDCFVFSIKSIDSRFLAAVSLPEGHQLLCIFVFSAALTIPDHCWWSGHSVSPANPGARLFEGQRHLDTTTSLPRAPLLLPPPLAKAQWNESQ